MSLPELIIGNLKAAVPIVQGGMGIGVSLHRLAAAVANEGGMGVISGCKSAFANPIFITNNLEANLRALKREINLARELSPKGIIGVNPDGCHHDYVEYVKTCVREKIDLIISGAGLPMELPALVKGSDVKIAPSCHREKRHPSSADTGTRNIRQRLIWLFWKGLLREGIWGLGEMS
jgi:NAD(P)H-dependent flavin oxidoreductase YrpB (nitropropane dioxygenase family)